MLKLRKFDLEFAFARACALRKDVQDERGAIEDFDLENLFQIARLRGGKFIVKDDSVHIVGFAVSGKFLGLTLSDVGGGIGCLDFLNAFADDFRASGSGEFGKFVQRLAKISGVVGLQFHADEENPLRPCVSGLY